MSDRIDDQSPRERMWKGITKDRTSDDTGTALCYSDRGKPLHRKEIAMQPRTTEQYRTLRVAGPYRESNGRYRLRILDGTNETKRSYATEQEALSAKLRLEVSPEEAKDAYVSKVYQEGYGQKTRYRIHVFDGRRTTKPSFSTYEEAERARVKFEGELSNRREMTVTDLIDHFTEYMRVVKGNRKSSIENTEPRLRRFFQSCPDLFARSVTQEKAEELYHLHIASPNQKTGERLSDCTQQHDLRRVRSMFAWAVKRGFVTTNPFHGVELIGRPKKGKKQLTFDQAKHFIRAALSRFELKDDRLALASVVVLTTGARAKEVLLRTVGELDHGCSELIVQERDQADEAGEATVKNNQANRRLHILPAIQPYLETLAAGRPRSALLFRQNGTSGETARVLLRRKIMQICQEEGLPTVTTHSFRGLYATSLFRKTRDMTGVAELMGHSDFGQTKGAYIDPRALQQTQSAAAAEALGFKDPGQEAERILANCDGPTLAALVRLLPERVPGLLIGATSHPTAQHGTKSFPNRSRDSDRPTLSDGDA